jgi:hypothetical protein
MPHMQQTSKGRKESYSDGRTEERSADVWEEAGMTSYKAELFQEARESYYRRSSSSSPTTALLLSQVQLALSNIRNIAKGRAIALNSRTSSVEDLTVVYQILISPPELITFEM